MRNATIALALICGTCHPGVLAAEARPARPVDAHARTLAATCASCHAPSVASVTSLTGMSETDIVRALQEFKSGTRAGTVMPQLAKGYTDEQIDAIAAWYAGAKR